MKELVIQRLSVAATHNERTFDTRSYLPNVYLSFSPVTS